MKEYDLVVVGAGLAGLTAGLFGARYGLRSAVVDKMGAGGQVLNVEKVENFPGFPEGIAGYDLGPIVQEQADAAGVEFMIDTVEVLEVEGSMRLLRCSEEDITARAVIVAAGSSLRSLGIPGEERLMGKGVSHCASCDAPFFTGLEACVIGGGDSALDEAAVLAREASRVFIFHHGPAYNAQQSVIDKIEAMANVEPRFNTRVEEIGGDDSVTHVKLLDITSGHTQEQAIGGVFVFVGLEPNTAFVRGVLELDGSGHIVTDLQMRASVEGVFAAGDIRQGSAAQLVTAAGDGATAAIAAYRYLKGLE
jgi:thioredoxin reductase (NADPH)